MVMEDSNDQVEARLDKLERARKMGINPYPYAFPVTHTATRLNQEGDALVASGQELAAAGRLVAIRRQGKAAFCHLKDDHVRFQIYLREDEVGPEAFQQFDLLDLGDFMGVRGVMMRTKTGELTLRVKSWQMLAKALRPLPVAKVEQTEEGAKVHEGLKDTEFRYRHRGVDLAASEDAAGVFIKRTKIIHALRNYLVSEGFMEVETPVLQVLYGGAAATPFTSRHKALDLPLYLRISDELYLKRLVAGGFNRVFEIGKDFRNEGIDRSHNPEFTMVEFYQAYADYTDMMRHMENIWAACAMAAHGSLTLTYQHTTIDLTPPWKRMTMEEALRELGGIDFPRLKDDEVKTLLKHHDWDDAQEYSRGMAMAHLFQEICETKLIQPTFITDFPEETTPLCKAHRDKPGLVERFEPYIAGWEIGNAYSELNDPLVQRQLFEQQAARRSKGDQEAHPYDREFVRTMEYGMPPMGGAGIGVDRMVMLLTNSYSIRDVIFFPTMRPEPQDKT
ncbi:MAG: lysine--tRNA ligase [Deltaproteobacteria bacterium]|nr:lysine--tRNA ligase [Deltaproteobacteria bacterium]